MNNLLKTCNGCGSFQNFYNNNISWEIKWSSRDNAFVFFLYVREINGVRIYAELIPINVLIASSNNVKGIGELAKQCINKLVSFYNINLQ